MARRRDCFLSRAEGAGGGNVGQSRKQDWIGLGLPFQLELIAIKGRPQSHARTAIALMTVGPKLGVASEGQKRRIASSPLLPGGRLT